MPLQQPVAGGEDATRPPSRGLLRRPTLRHAVLALAVLAAVGAAYHYTLGTLISGLALDSPLAYLGLVPLVAAGLAVALARRQTGDHDIHDRQVDLLVGLPLVGLALLLVLALPERLGSEFWLWRLDLLSLPVFAAGLVALLLGTRVLWRVRAALLFLLVAWPIPWNATLERTDQPLLDLTTSAVRGVTGVVPVAQPYGREGGSGDAMFEVLTSSGSFVVTVASACAGASSTLGFLLLGSAWALVTRGPRRNKALWLLTGLAIAWLGNVLRILLLLVAGRWGGESLALDTLHPVLGTVVFAGTCLVMLVLAPRFGLHLPERVGSSRSAQVTGLAASSRWGRVVVAGALTAATVAAGTANGALAANEQVVGPYGQARLAAFATGPAALPGWRIGQAGDFPQAARYFGAGSTWRRLLYHSPVIGAGSSVPALPVSVDAVGTRSLRALKAFGVEECYAFHRFEVSSHGRVSLGAGLHAELFTYFNRRDQRNWNTLAWEWPVRHGAATRYERVVLVLVDVAGVPLPALDGSPVPGSEQLPTAQRLAGERDFLKAFARALVSQLVARDVEASTT